MPDGLPVETCERPGPVLDPPVTAGPIYRSEPIADVALIGQVGERVVYSYRIPVPLLGRLAPGMLVQVPFGSRALQGIVLSTDLRDPGGIRLRDVVDILDPLPCLTRAQIDLAQWIAVYYACSLTDAIGTMLPAGLDRATEAIYAENPGAPSDRVRLTEIQRDLLDAVRDRGPATARQLAGPHDMAGAGAAIESLVRRGMIARTYRLGRAAVVDQIETLVVLQPEGKAIRLGVRQRAIVEYLRDRGGEASLPELRDELGVDTATVERLSARRVVMTYARPVRRDPLAYRQIAPHQAPRFTAEQESVYRSIGEAIANRDGTPILVHGVTGSGKTEVYLRAVADTLARRRQAIVLVPEIGLTPQAVTRFAGRFPAQVALLHSRLSSGERFDEWQRIRRGDCSVAVGPRSAIFSPFADVGLIVIDEEHDSSYKQDSLPRYHTRDVAEHLARSTGAVVILGSATPDVVSFYRAQRGDYRLLTMRSRVGTGAGARVPGRTLHSPGGLASANGLSADRVAEAGLPSVQIVDMRLELKAGNRSIFSRALASALRNVLARDEQAILFLNRRGNATFVNCRDCGHVEKCPHCDLPFTYHSQGQTLLCHRCDARSPLPTICTGCGSWRIRYFGLGTQKVEQEMLSRFPMARVQRYDRDVTSGKHGHEAILERFAAGEIDVLVGTQIVAKGLDFPRVTLVGAVSADTSINLPDFRAAERTFSLLTQVAGRAGRAGLPGTVVVQSYSPGHFAIQAAAQHDYLAFYRDEIQYRQEGLYPPFSQLVRLVRSDKSYDVCRAEAHVLADKLSTWTSQCARSHIDIIGPAPCFMGKAHDRFFWQILLRGPDVHPILSEVPRGWAIDVDPMNLL